MHKIRAVLGRLLPQNSLFGRILLWFWLAVTVMVILAFVIARYANQSWEVSALHDDQLAKVSSIPNNLQKMLSKNIELPRAMRRMSSRGRWNLMAIDIDTNEFTLGFPAPLLSQQAKFIELIDAQQLLMVRTSNMEFAGPFLITKKDTKYMLFVGHLLRREQRPIFAFGLAFVVFLATGTLACIGIAWTIAKPIKQLSQLSKQFAAGDMQAANKGISERKDELGQLHNDIYDMATNLAKSLAQQKTLMANISHELRTPLTRLQLAIAMLQPKDENQTRYTQRIEKDIGIMDSLIGQSLELARMNDERQAQWLQSEVVQLAEVLSPIIEDLAFEAQAKEVDLSINRYPDVKLPLIPHSFTSALENVTRNAIKFCNKQVKLEVTTSTHITSGKDSPEDCTASFLIISIEDDGDGLSDKEIAHIFEPFYRVSNNRQFEGFGLGLAIAKAAVELHDGFIDSSTSALGGLKLTLYFPMLTETVSNQNDELL